MNNCLHLKILCTSFMFELQTIIELRGITARLWNGSFPNSVVLIVFVKVFLSKIVLSGDPLYYFGVFKPWLGSNIVSKYKMLGHCLTMPELGIYIQCILGIFWAKLADKTFGAQTSRGPNESGAQMGNGPKCVLACSVLRNKWSILVILLDSAFHFL